MKLTSSLSLAAALVILPGTAFAQTTGVSHPDDAPDSVTAPTTSPATDDSHYVKPSAGALDTTTAPVLHEHDDSTVVYGTYKPYVPASASTPVQTAEIRHTNQPMVVTDDPNSGVIIDVSAGDNELPLGTMLKASLQDDISTKATAAGTNFTAVLSVDTGRHGKVYLPSGTVVNGRITQIHGGRRIGGPAAIRLQPDSVTLPDGTTYHINAEVTDLDHFKDSHVNSEGTIVGNSNAKATVAALSLTTGSAVAAGAVLGGGVGAVVGLGVGAGAGAIWWLKHDREQTLPKGTEVVFMLDSGLVLNSR